VLHLGDLIAQGPADAVRNDPAARLGRHDDQPAARFSASAERRRRCVGAGVSAAPRLAGHGADQGAGRAGPLRHLPPDQ
jgi:hypothetical protein